MADVNEIELVHRINVFLLSKCIDSDSNTLFVCLDTLIKSAKDTGKKRATIEIQRLFQDTVNKVENFIKDERYDDIVRLSDNVLQIMITR